MRRILWLMLAACSATSALAIHYEWRYVMSIGAVAPNSDQWTPFRMGDHIMVGGYGGDLGGALVCGRYETHPERVPMTIIDEKGRKIQTWGDVTVTNWLELFVLTNYPNARYWGIIGRELNSGFEAVRLGNMEVNLSVTCPVLDWSRLPPPSTNSAGIPVGWIVQTAPLYDYGVPCQPPTNTPATYASPTNKPPQEESGKGEYRLGMRYLNGEGVGKDAVTARDLFIKAASKGYPEAKEQLLTNTHPVFVEWRVANITKNPPLAPQDTNAVSSNTNKNEPAQQNLPDETPQGTNAMPAAPPVTKPDESAALAQLKAANAALEERLSKSEEQLLKLQASAPQSKPSFGNWRWYLVVGLLLVIVALWFFSVARREPG